YRNALGSRCSLKKCILLDREIMGLVLPKEHRPSVWRLVSPAVNGALKELRPNQRCVLPNLSIFSNGNINHDYLPIQNVIWRQVSSRSKELTDFAAGERVEHPGEIRVNRFTC